MRATEILAKKRRGEELSFEEMSAFLNSFLEGETPDYQMSAWLMAICFQGMTEKESQAWTRLMWKSGSSLNRESRTDFWIDKHSTGGVGDKTSLLLVPLVFSASEKLFGKGKVKLPMISGRGLGHTGGTLDKLESVPGFSCRKNLSEASALLNKNGFFMIGQSEDIAPADKRIYALRDATATVESVPLIVSSILSKKLAENLDGIVFDVKAGVGAFMKTTETAQLLAKELVSGAKSQGLQAVALVTRMEEPIGTTIGNSIEVLECWDFLNGHQEPKFKELVMELGTWMLSLAGRGEVGLSDCRKVLEAEIDSSRSKELFVKMFENQEGRWQEFLDTQRSIPFSHQEVRVVSKASGWIRGCNALILGEWVREIGGGRQKTTDEIDSRVGLRLLKKVGEKVDRGEVVAIVTVKKGELVQKVQDRVSGAFQIESSPREDFPVVAEVIQ